MRDYPRIRGGRRNRPEDAAQRECVTQADPPPAEIVRLCSESCVQWWTVKRDKSSGESGLWAALKRAHEGIYHVKHLQRYLTGFAGRYNDPGRGHSQPDAPHRGRSDWQASDPQGVDH